jgi:hypothetical protein
MGWLDRYIEKECPNGTTRLILKEPQKDIPLVFSEYVPEWEFKLSIGLKIAKELITGHASATIKKSAKKLYDEIKEIDATAITLFKMRYLQYAGNPCANDNILDKAIDEITKETYRLVGVNKQLEKLKIKARRAPKKMDLIKAEEIPEVQKIDALLDKVNANLRKAIEQAEKS